MTWAWILAGLLVLLLLIVVRERFETYEEALASVGQTAGYITPSCPEGYTMNSESSLCEQTTEDGSTDTVDPTCPANAMFVRRGTRGVCEPIGPVGSTETEMAASGPTGPTEPSQSESTASGSTGPPGSAGSGTTSGTTTGGTSGVTFGPTSGSRGLGRTVWGPVFKGIGDGTGPVDGDSTKTNTYPTLLGGLHGRTSTRLEGVGLVPPSGLGLDTVMPSSSALGTDANSRFLPYSRQPGDMDVVADPYRLATNFSTSSYSASKTDPVPFLTDFSAFYR